MCCIVSCAQIQLLYHITAYKHVSKNLLSNFIESNQETSPTVHSPVVLYTNHLFLGDVVCVLWVHRPVWVVIHKLLAPVFGLPNGNTRSGLYNMNSALHCVKTVDDIVWPLVFVILYCLMLWTWGSRKATPNLKMRAASISAVPWSTQQLMNNVGNSATLTSCANVNDIVWHKFKHCLSDIHKMWYCTLSISHIVNWKAIPNHEMRATSLLFHDPCNNKWIMLKTHIICQVGPTHTLNSMVDLPLISITVGDSRSTSLRVKNTT